MKALRGGKSKLANLLLVALFLASVPMALASNTWYVDGVNGNDDNDCTTEQTACKTIGHAIALAHWRDSIMVAPAVYTENLQIKHSVKIVGSDAATTIVDGNQVTTVFWISYTKAHVYLSNLTIRNGSGSGITNSGTLTINKSIVSGNWQLYLAGGISNGGTLTINDSTVSGNSGYEEGGGIYNAGTLTINNSTVSENSAGYYGGGIYNAGTLTINNSTVSENSARSGGGGIYTYGGTTTLQNSILANNSRGNCYNDPITSNGYNLSSDGTCNFTGPGDMNNTRPKLGKLGNWGGPTPTIKLLKGSPAIDAGNPNGCTDDKGNLLKTDQRGKPRPDKKSGRCDMGAFEKQTD